MQSQNTLIPPAPSTGRENTREKNRPGAFLINLEPLREPGGQPVFVLNFEPLRFAILSLFVICGL